MNKTIIGLVLGASFLGGIAVVKFLDNTDSLQNLEQPASVESYCGNLEDQTPYCIYTQKGNVVGLYTKDSPTGLCFYIEGGNLDFCESARKSVMLAAPDVAALQNVVDSIKDLETIVRTSRLQLAAIQGE